MKLFIFGITLFSSLAAFAGDQQLLELKVKDSIYDRSQVSLLAIESGKCNIYSQEQLQGSFKMEMESCSFDGKTLKVGNATSYKQCKDGEQMQQVSMQGMDVMRVKKTRGIFRKTHELEVVGVSEEEMEGLTLSLSKISANKFNSQVKDMGCEI